jgi:hypothetical protein
MLLAENFLIAYTFVIVRTFVVVSALSVGQEIRFATTTKRPSVCVLSQVDKVSS